MKWNMVFRALVVSVGLCGQSLHAGLLDRMLGLNDCGCSSCGCGRRGTVVRLRQRLRTVVWLCGCGCRRC